MKAKLNDLVFVKIVSEIHREPLAEILVDITKLTVNEAIRQWKKNAEYNYPVKYYRCYLSAIKVYNEPERAAQP